MPLAGGDTGVALAIVRPTSNGTPSCHQERPDPTADQDFLRQIWALPTKNAVLRKLAPTRVELSQDRPSTPSLLAKYETGMISPPCNRPQEKGKNYHVGKYTRYDRTWWCSGLRLQIYGVVTN